MKETIKDTLRVFVVPVDILETPDIDIYEQMVYMVLRSFCNAHKNEAFPSYATIARLGKMSRRKAIDAVQSLIEKGLLRKEMQFTMNENKQLRHKSNLYTLETPSAQRAPLKDVSSAQDAPASAQDAPPSAQRAPENNHLSLQSKIRKKERKKEPVENQLLNKIKELGENLYVNEPTTADMYAEEIYKKIMMSDLADQVNDETLYHAAQVWISRDFNYQTRKGQRYEVMLPDIYFLDCLRESLLLT